jgi:diguanylate cyclase (GGDEF)-like protein
MSPLGNTIVNKYWQSRLRPNKQRLECQFRKLIVDAEAQQMEIELKLNILLFCSQIAMLMFGSLQNKKERNRLDYRLFLAMLLVVCVELIAGSAALVADGSGSRLGQAVLRNSVVINFATISLVTMMYAIYVEYATFGESRRPRKRIALYLLPSFGVLCLSFASLFTGWLFSFDESGHWRNGRFSYLPTIVSYGYLVFAIVVLMRRRKTMSSRDFANLASFPVPIAVLGVLQSFLQEYVILMPANILSLFILYADIQERRLTYDYLTGAYNRKRLDEYLGAMIDGARGSGKAFSAFLGDVNDFKRINDSFGHTEGDAALIAVTRTIKKCLRSDDFLARYAGDEFVAVLPNCGEGELHAIMDRIADSFRSYSESQGKYPLSISLGGAVFDPAADTDAEALIKRMDGMMYAEKKNKPR